MFKVLNPEVTEKLPQGRLKRPVAALFKVCGQVSSKQEATHLDAGTPLEPPHRQAHGANRPCVNCLYQDKGNSVRGLGNQQATWVTPSLRGALGASTHGKVWVRTTVRTYVCVVSGPCLRCMLPPLERVFRCSNSGSPLMSKSKCLDGGRCKG